MYFFAKLYAKQRYYIDTAVSSTLITYLDYGNINKGIAFTSFTFIF